jgi:hypothetical protein
VAFLTVVFGDTLFGEQRAEGKGQTEKMIEKIAKN